MPSIPTLQYLCIIEIWENGSVEVQSYLNIFMNSKFDDSSTVSQANGSDNGYLEENKDGFINKRREKLKEFLSVAIENKTQKENVRKCFECKNQESQRNDSLKIQNIELHMKNFKLECEIDCIRANNEKLVEEITRNELAFNQKHQEEVDGRDGKEKEFAEQKHKLSCCLEALRQCIKALYLLKINKKNLETENEKLQKSILDLNKEVKKYHQNFDINFVNENQAECKNYKTLNVKLMDLMNLVQVGEMTIAKLEDDKAKLEEKCQQLEEHIKLFQQKSETETCVSNKCAKLRKDMEILESDSDYIHELYKTLLDNKKLMTVEIVNLEEECENLKCENKKLSVYVINMQSQVAQSQQQIGSFIQCITELSGRCTIDKEDLDQLENHNSELMKQVKVLEAIQQVFDDLELVSPRENNLCDFEGQIIKANNMLNKITGIQQNLKTVTDENIKVKKHIETLKILDNEFKELKEQFQQLKNDIKLMVKEEQKSDIIIKSKVEEKISDQYNEIIKLNMELQNLLRQYTKLEDGYNKLVCEYENVGSKKTKYKHNCKVLQKFARMVRSDFEVWEREKRSLVQQVAKYKDKCQRMSQQINAMQKSRSVVVRK